MPWSHLITGLPNLKVEEVAGKNRSACAAGSTILRFVRAAAA
jgi:hypothetical protein